MGQQVLLALVLGIACGLFLGEFSANIAIIGDIYVGLLQMMVLPYILLSLVSGVGRLSLGQARLTQYSGFLPPYATATMKTSLGSA